MTFASGGSFSKFSHEFQTVTPAGEDTIYIDEDKNLAINKEVFTDDVLSELGIEREKLVERKSIEVGNIFELKTKYSAPFDFVFKDENGKEHTVLMGCYGIGISRLLGTVVEVLGDDKGMIWPEEIAPFKVHLLSLGADESAREEAQKLHDELEKAGVEVLFDDRDISAGEKFADSDLIGIPYRVVISERSLKDGGVEVKKRTEEKGKIIGLKEAVKEFKKHHA
jgi:prolyl-tRNA synthetase